MEEHSRCVNFHFLTSERSSEHIYADELRTALVDHGVGFTSDWYDADLVHLFEVNLFTVDTLSSFDPLTLLRILRSDTPVAVSLDDLYFIGRPEFTDRPYLYALNHRVQRWLLAHVDAIIAISDSVKRSLSQFTDPDSVYTVPHGVNESYFPGDSDVVDRGYVLHVSLTSDRKNPEAVVEMAERLDRRFVIAGAGWKDIVPRRLTRQNVDVTGYVPESELVNLYHGASVFYFPTRHEGFGLPVLEAMAAETAVVTSDVYSVPEVTGEAALLCDPEDVDTHEFHIRRLLANDEERWTLARMARRRAESFTWANAAKQIEQVYRSLTSSECVETTLTQ